MDNLIHNEAKLKQFNLGSTEGAETDEETSISIKDPDTMLTMVVLLLACLGLALLAHAVV